MLHVANRLLVIFAVFLGVGCGQGGGDDADVLATLQAPTLGTAIPDNGPLTGGDRVTLLGSGFEAEGAGTLQIRLGGIAANLVEILDDGMLEIIVPPGAAGTADIEVISSNGRAVLAEGYLYVADATSLYAADGTNGLPGSLYRVDPVTGQSEVVGEIGFAVNGLATSPGGEIFATEATDFGALGGPRLLRIDPISGAGTVVGPLIDSSFSFHHAEIPDIAFVRDRLIGWSEHRDAPVEIDPATGVVTVIGPAYRSDGDGVAGATSASAYVTPERNDGGLLLHLDLSTGEVTEGATLSGTTIVDGRIVAMSRFQDGLLGVLRDIGGIAPSNSSSLIAINPDTGAVTLRGPLPDGVTALVAGP